MQLFAQNNPYLESKINLLMKLRNMVLDIDLLSVFEKIPREIFLPTQYKRHAYEDISIPLDDDNYMLAPSIIANIINSLDAKGKYILEIAGNTGYLTTILSHIARRVYMLETNHNFLELANNNFAKLGRNNIISRNDTGQGWIETSPFERIIISKIITKTPEVILKQLADGGILIAIIEKDFDKYSIIKITNSNGKFIEEEIYSFSEI